MASRAQWQKQPEHLHLIGDLQFDNVVALRREGEDWLKQSPTTSTLNFAKVTFSNSAGVALIVSLHRHAKALGKHLIVEQVPDNLESMMRLGGLEWLLNSPQHPQDQ